MTETASVTAVFGRARELARADAFLESATERCSVVLFEGEAGIGKTTLWRAGVERARELGFRVLESRSADSERKLSFAGLGDVLSEAHDEIGRLPAPQRRALRVALLLEEAGREPADERAVGAALLGLLRLLAEDEPLLIALDDLQWLDDPSAAAMQFAFRRLAKERVGVLATVRSGALTFSFEGAERAEVGPLGLDALDQLVASRLEARFLRPTLRRLEEASGGNPFYALEIAAGLLRSGRGPASGEPLPIPARLREVTCDRLALLSPAAREAALATAALAQPTIGTIQQVVGGGFAAVSEAVAVGVLDRDGGALRFTHPLFASTLYEESSPGERSDLHQRLAEVVADPEEQARHLAEAAAGPDEKVAAALEAAAASVAARGAPDAAARLARQAVELTPPDLHAESHRRRLDWARYSVAAGDPLQAEALLERQLEQVEPGRRRAEAELELGNVWLATRGRSAARACYERALAELEHADELELETMVLIELADADVAELELDSDCSDRAVACAEELGEPNHLARALGIHGTKLTLLDRPPPAEYWRRAFEVEAAAGELRGGGPTVACAFAAFLCGDLETAFELTGRVAESMRRNGDPMLPSVLIELSELVRVSGDWAAASRYLEEAHDLVLQTGRESLEPLCLLWKARIALPRGDLDQARQHAEDATALVERLAPSDGQRALIESLATSVFGQIAEVSGRHEEAHESCVAAIEVDEQLGKISEHALAECLAADVGHLVALGALEEAASQLERLLELTDSLGLLTLAGFVARAQGVLAAAEGDSVAAIGFLERAVESFEELAAPWPFEHARTLLTLGCVQRRAGQKLASRKTLGQALAIFEGLGARLWAEKTRAELRQISGRPTRSGALTATEQGIARLVATGHSNAEVAHELFISPKTVEWNLSKIYKKLRVRSRTELAAKLAKLPVSL
jgi:DNA-binding CsgD family transcriptional regulator